MSEPTWELLGGGGVVGGPIDYVGNWAAGTTYQPGQVVRYGGIDYLAVNPSLGQVPPVGTPLLGGIGTTLPSSPVDGMEAILVDSLTNPSYNWRFRYNAGSASPYKWEFIGGTIWEKASEGTVTATGTATDAGPTFTVPRNGDYHVEGGARVTCATGSFPLVSILSDGTNVLDEFLTCQAGGLHMQVYAIAGFPIAVAGSRVIGLRYRVAGPSVTATWDRRRLSVQPVRVA